MKQPTIKHLSKIQVEHAHGGSGSRQLIFSQEDECSSPQLEAVTKGFLPKGGVFDWHHHEGVDEFFWVVSGVGRIEYKNDIQFDYSAGDFIYNPADLSHRIINTGEDDNVFFFVRVNA
jgi:mannose-6-phosphate isomerase-like protein (cupin superfamily)